MNNLLQENTLCDMIFLYPSRTPKKGQISVEQVKLIAVGEGNDKKLCRVSAAAQFVLYSQVQKEI